MICSAGGGATATLVWFDVDENREEDNDESCEDEKGRDARATRAHNR